ncbi:hypothetical protein KGM_206395 [Danaus plexippus plexippus]|uniref:Uncharacterized protein n=1 Tax=Danaus plexippus plexippus TaxID=278856 RepID=A0A212EQV9_DANPL|nr:hypothetical protein KGM_206395 [Danaus plexippus plexippus]
MPSLVAGGTGADPGRSTVTPVHTLRVTESGPTMLSHVPLGTLADLLTVTPALVRAFFIAFRIRSCSRERRLD